MEAISPSLATSKQISQKVLRVLASSGVDSVLVGMRSDSYAREILESDAMTPISTEEASRILSSPKTKIQKIDIALDEDSLPKALPSSQ